MKNLVTALSFLDVKTVEAAVGAYMWNSLFAWLAVATGANLVLAAVSARVQDHLHYLAQTRYTGKLVCTAKRELRWDGSKRLDGHFCRLTQDALRRLNEPHIIEAKLDNGTLALLSVSPHRFERARVGETLPRHVARTVLRTALFTV